MYATYSINYRPFSVDNKATNRRSDADCYGDVDTALERLSSPNCDGDAPRGVRTGNPGHDEHGSTAPAATATQPTDCRSDAAAGCRHVRRSGSIVAPSTVAGHSDGGRAGAASSHQSVSHVALSNWPSDTQSVGKASIDTLSSSNVPAVQSKVLSVDRRRVADICQRAT